MIEQQQQQRPQVLIELNLMRPLIDVSYDDDVNDGFHNSQIMNMNYDD